MSKNKKIKFLALGVMIIFLFVSCGKKEAEKKPEMKSPDVVKYARYKVAVYKEKDMVKWLATLSKAEPVNLNKIEEIEIKSKKTEVAEVTLSDGSVGYTKAGFLADAPLVFTEDTKAYVRNNVSSKITATIPRGTIVFTLSERAEWTKIYVGKLDGKYVADCWVNGGFVKDAATIQDAKILGEALELLSSAKDAKDKNKAMEMLKSIEGSARFGDIVKDKLGSTSNIEIDMTGKAIITAASGLKLRESDSTESGEIVVIPSKEVVEIVQKGAKEETIAGKTAFWYEIKWKDKQGWAFGGFLDIK